MRTADPFDPPLIDPGYLSHEDDITRMVQGMRLARGIAATRPLSDLLIAETWPGAAVQSNLDLSAAALHEVGPYEHPVGTCRMGPTPAHGAVVDASLKVHGLEGLYVVDASIMPEIPAANTNVPTIMVAEHWAEMVRKNQR